MKVKTVPQKFNVDRVPSQPKKKRRKVTIVFDEEKRKEFLTGFHKRKLQRQKKSKEDLEKQLKEEKKKIKQGARERYKKLLGQKQHVQVPDLEEFLSKNEYETENHTVSILEVDASTLNKNGIGLKQVDYESEAESVKEEEPDENEVEGFGAKKEPAKNTNPPPEAQKVSLPGTKKEMKKSLRNSALKQVKRSNVFKIKENLDRHKNKKRAKREEMRKEKAMKKGKKNKQHKKLKSMNKGKNKKKISKNADS